MGLPRVFFDMAADGQSVGRIVIEVSMKVAWIRVKSAGKICRLVKKCGFGCPKKSKMVEGYG
jgi:hypothetical protein